MAGVARELLVSLVLFDDAASGFISVIILSDNYQLQLPVGSFTVLTWPSQLTAHTRGGVAAESDKRQLPDKMKDRRSIVITLSTLCTSMSSGM
jgi:hypothetical protein